MDKISYDPLGLSDGTTLNAGHVGRIESGIIAAINAINNINNEIETNIISPIDEEELKDILV